MIVDYSSAIVKFVLDEYPESINIPDGDGRLPLHIAIEHGLPCWQILADAEPRAMERLDPNNRLYPFQTAALVSSDTEQQNPYKFHESTNTIYTLLRKAPHVVMKSSRIKDAKWNNPECRSFLRNKLEIEKIKYDARHKISKIEDTANKKILALEASNGDLKRKFGDMGS